MLPIKLVTLGEGRVGKSSLLLRFSRDSFDVNSPSTLAASFIEKRVILGTTSVTLNLWDTAGQECFHALGPLYYRDADCALVVFDLTDRQSFVKCQSWVNELRTMVAKDLPICLAGNKSDILSLQVPGLEEEAELFAEKIHARFFPTSALLNRNVDACFLYLANAVVERHKNIGIQEDEEEEEPAIRLGETHQNNDNGCCM